MVVGIAISWKKNDIKNELIHSKNVVIKTIGTIKSLKKENLLITFSYFNKKSLKTASIENYLSLLNYLIILLSKIILFKLSKVNYVNKRWLKKIQQQIINESAYF